MSSSPEIILSNGVKMPQAAESELKGAVKHAVDVGYRLIDTAELYGNEEAIGEAVRELIEEGKARRSDLFITTKCFSTHLRPDDIEPALKESLQKLRMDYVDLYLIHNPCAVKADMSGPTEHPVTVEEMWRVFEELYHRGYARAIGVSNMNLNQIRRIMRIASVPIHNVQVEMSIYWPQREVQEYCRTRNISLTSYATLGSSGRVDFKLTLANGQQMIWEDHPSPLQDKNVTFLSQKYKKTPAQILLRYAMERGFAVIPKSIKKERIEKNFQLADFTLSKEEVKLLESSPHRHRVMPLLGRPSGRSVHRGEKCQIKSSLPILYNSFPWPFQNDFVHDSRLRQTNRMQIGLSAAEMPGGRRLKTTTAPHPLSTPLIAVTVVEKLAFLQQL